MCGIFIKFLEYGRTLEVKSCFKCPLIYETINEVENIQNKKNGMKE